MNEGGLVDDVLVVDREMRWLESRRLAAVYELVFEARTLLGNQFAKWSVCEELRLARRVSRGECVGVVELAVELHERVPELLACLQEGLFDQLRARQACEAMRSLRTEQARAAAAAIAERLRTGERPFDWRGFVRRVADSITPEAKQRRAAQARGDRWARCEPGPDGAGMLLAQLPNEVLAACATRIEATARSRRAGGDQRNLEQLRADTLAELLLGGCDECDTEYGDAPGNRYRAIRMVVNVHVALGTVLRLDEHDATADGYGTIPAEAARELLHDPANVVRKVLTDPDTGAVVGLGRRRYRPTRRQRDYVHARDRHCRTPGCTRPIAELDHVQPWHRGGRTDPENLQGLCKLDHTLKALPGWEHQPDRHTGALALTTPTGRTYRGDPDPAPF